MASNRGDGTHQAAEMLLNAYKTGVPCAPVRTLLAKNDIEAAYSVQRLQVEHWRSSGRRVVGRKIGLTAKAVQRQLGVDQPDFGVLFADMCLGDSETIAAGRVLQPKVEAEVALVLEHDLKVEHATVADLLLSVAFAVPAIEIVGSRIANWDIKIVDTIADNASSGLFALGGPPRRLAGLDLVACKMSLSKNGATASEGTGAACLGSPLNAAAWLARKMVELGQPLLAGEVIMTGALGPMLPVTSGDRIEATISGLGVVRIDFA